jgi:hypothetical protein
MPKAAKFLASFGFREGSQFDDYILDVARAEEIVIKRYQEYKYNIRLEFEDIGNGTWDKLYNILKKTITQEHIVKGVRNPYKCVIDSINHGDAHEDEHGIVIVYLTGHAYRQ